MKKYLLPAAIILVAAFFRLYRLNELPPGLHYDEAFNAVQAERVLAGVERPIYFTEDLTEEPMAIYTTAVFFSLFGPSPYSVRLVSAFVGILTVAAMYFLARALFPPRRHDSPALPGAALSAFILAILYWHVNFSRLGMEPIFLPLMLILGMGFLLRALRYNPLAPFPKREGGWGFGGLFLALTFYTYKAALFVPIFVGAFLASEMIFNRASLMRQRRGLGIFFAVSVLAFSPLGLYWATHPGEFIERPATVLVAPATIAENAAKVGAMFFLRGDENPRSNLPGRAALDLFGAVGFIVGILVCLARFRRLAPRVMLLWLIAMVLPSVFSDFAPHFGRSIAATPAIALVSGCGLATLVERIPYRLPALVLFFGLITFSTWSTFNDYFNVWAARTGNFDSFDVGLLSLARKLRAEPAGESLFVTPVDGDHYTLQFGLGGAETNSFDGRRALVLPPAGSSAAYGIVTRSDSRTRSRLEKIFPTARAVETLYDFAAQPYAVIFRVEGAGPWTPQKRVDARLGEDIALIGYDVARTGNEIALTIYWASLAATHTDYTVFVHLLDPIGRVIAQDDAQPGHLSYPTSRWRAGQVIADDYRLVVPTEMSGALQIEVGMYKLETGARLRLIDANGTQMENDRVLIERLAIP